MKRFATVRNGKVDRVFTATDEALLRMLAAAEAKVAELRAAIDVSEITVGPGYLYDAEQRAFTPPEEPAAPPAEPSVEEKMADLQRQIDTLKQGVGRGK